MMLLPDRIEDDSTSSIVCTMSDGNRSVVISVPRSEEFLWKTPLILSFCSLNRAEAAALERKSFFRRRALTSFRSTC
jgi:hypothetical protein